MMKQIIKFGVVGMLCFVLDFGAFTLFTNVAEINYLIANAASFTFATLVNYHLSAKHVFGNTGLNSPALFFILSIIGLGLSQMLMSRLTIVMNYDFAKLISVIIVMAYNYTSRKLLFEKAPKAFFPQVSLFKERGGTSL